MVNHGDHVVFGMSCFFFADCAKELPESMVSSGELNYNNVIAEVAEGVLGPGADSVALGSSKGITAYKNSYLNIRRSTVQPRHRKVKEAEHFAVQYIDSTFIAIWLHVKSVQCIV